MPPKGEADSNLDALLSGADAFGAVLEILGVAVLADRLSRDREMLEFCASAQRIARELDPSVVVSRRELRAWFATHRERLGEVAGSEEARATLLARLEPEDLRTQTLVGVFGISVCDYHLADEECAFINQALEAWQLELPSEDVVAALG